MLARKSSPEATLRKIDALLDCRTALEGNVAPLLAVESTMISLAADHATGEHEILTESPQ